MDAIANQISALAKSADASTRKSIINTLRELSYSIEEPDDTLARLWGGHLTMASIRTAIDLKLFNLLADNDGPIAIAKLQEITGAEFALLARLCRNLASLSIIKEAGIDEFGANSTTRLLATPGNQGCIRHYFDTCGPVYQQMPAFLRKTGFKNPTDQNDTVWQVAHSCTENCYDWMMTHPQSFEQLNLYLMSRSENLTSAFDRWTPDPAGVDSERAVFVDIGGAIGVKCAEFKQKFPNVPGRVILQDMLFAIEHAIPTPNVEKMVHDFMTPQPIKGAKYYYFRAVLHDWPDEKCRTILENTMAAMAPDSQILIDDMVPPNKGVGWQVTNIDLTMMGAGGAVERTVAEWQHLFDSVRLKIASRTTFNPSLCETLTAVVPK